VATAVIAATLHKLMKVIITIIIITQMSSLLQYYK